MIPGTMIPQPQQPQQQQGMTAEQLLAQLQQQKQQADAAVTAATQKAMVPTSSMAGGTSPGLTMNPVQPYQQQSYNNRQPLSQKQGQGQGIQNILTAAANIVGKYGQKRQQEQQRALSVDLERVFQSVDGIQQAQDALKLDPNNKDAQAAVKKDQGIIDALLSDPKKQKQIAKALDISFTDPSSNAGPEHDALKQAAKSYSQQLMDKIPQGMKPNPAAIQQLQLAQAQQKSANDAIEKIAPTVIREGAANDREQFRQQSENQRTIARLNSDAQKSQNEIAGRFQTAMSVAKTNQDAAMARTQYKAQADYQRAMDSLRMREQLINQRGLSGDKYTSAIQRSYKLAQDQNTKALAQVNQALQARDMVQNPKGGKRLEGSNPQLEPFNSDIRYWKEQLKVTQDEMDKYQKILTPEERSAAGGQSTTKSDTGSNSKVVGQSADSDEDDSDIYGVSDDNTEQ
jgi:hypothetical protein